jgi:AraC-like DNA-binding protein
VYREIAPSPALAEWVECFWTRQARSSVQETTQRVLPDNCADLLFDLDDGRGFVVGTMTAPLLLTGRRTPAFFGIRFLPGRALPFAGAPLHELTDALQPLGGSLAEELAEAVDDEGRVRMAEASLARTLARAEARDARVDAAVARLTARAESIDDVAAAVGLTRQHLRRRFLEHVGITPKTFARVARFRRLLSDARASARAPWAALAADHGYADQSHLIAEFRELAGTSPVPFFLSP